MQNNLKVLGSKKTKAHTQDYQNMLWLPIPRGLITYIMVNFKIGIQLYLTGIKVQKTQ